MRTLAITKKNHHAVPWHRGWFPVVILPIFTVVAFPSEAPRWAFMWTLSFAIYCGCKWVTWRRTPAPDVPTSRHAGYLLAWPGLDAPAFLGLPSPSAAKSPTVREWLFSTAKFLFGVVLIWGVVRPVASDSLHLTGWIGLIGVVFVLHFGIFHLLSCGWRSIGVEAVPLMDWPILAESVSEFWGRRWNRAFRDLTHRFLFKPLARTLGPQWGLVVGFVFSGVIHDVVISFPAGGGYGGPTVFFVIQAVALHIERSRFGRRIGLGRGGRGHLFTALVLIAPLPLLLHRPFVMEVIVPYLAALGAIAG